MKSRQLALAAVIAVLISAGCSGRTSRVGPSATSMAPASTTRPPVIPDTAPLGTPTTISPKAAIEAELRAIFAERIRVHSACLFDPPMCDRVALVAQLETEDAANLLRTFDERVQKRIFARAPNNPDHLYYVIEGVEISPALHKAAVLVCWVDGLVQFTTENLPTPTEVVLNDKIEGSRRRYEYAWRNGQWKLVKLIRTADFDPLADNLCGARPK